MVYCYRVKLECTNVLHDTVVINDKYVKADLGIIYIICKDAQEVSKVFPDALIIERLGTGHIQ